MQSLEDGPEHYKQEQWQIAQSFVPKSQYPDKQSQEFDNWFNVLLDPETHDRHVVD